ncbi:MAG TPA: bifunctional UDP-N-acetylglucosamine diphosphorylase/glucosamine-1-phosphate N-acetyltransferase GlmU [Rickettsiales bacterium]|nr:bifunctional UDP-N-acetylglucosamine diphosphorylase/glucosamine-1-phosphate N-acetyltransferase GlmU [Rickettsiales bacterium]
MQHLSIIILAAGKGTRMRSELPKVMHKIAGREMLNMVLDEAVRLNPQEISVVISKDFLSHEKQVLNEYRNEKINFVLQKVRKGTADAVKIGLQSLKKSAQKFLILYGDTPLIQENTLLAMINKIEKNNALCVLGFDCDDDNSYGRLVVDVNGNLKKIVEFKDATVQEKQISLCNSGVMAVDGAWLEKLLRKVKNENAAEEFYLTDIIAIACEEGLQCSFTKVAQDEVLGVNSRAELAEIEKIKQNQLRAKYMEQGVTLLDPLSVYFSYDTKIAQDVIIHQNVVFGKKTVIEKGCEIKSFSHIEGAEIGANSSVGPFARIRADTKTDEEVHIGNFVEIKKSHIKSGAKINHLSYIGDSEIGVRTNIGAGVITCNYDGYKKHKTQIGKEVFVGSNSALLAPIKVGDAAVIGAGSVVTKDVAAHDLVLSRVEQINIENGGKKYRDKKTKKK